MSETTITDEDRQAAASTTDTRIAGYQQAVKEAQERGTDPQRDQSVRDQARDLIKGASKDPGLAREINKIETPAERKGLLAAKAEIQEEQLAERRGSFLEDAKSLAEKMSDPDRRERSLEAVEKMRNALEPSRDRTPEQERRDFERDRESEMEMDR